MRILVVTDNVQIYKEFKRVCEEKYQADRIFVFKCSPSSVELFSEHKNVGVVDVKLEYNEIIAEYDLVISCHCKKIFPKKLVNNVRCINIHPGLNPYNRGWYPQVFAINNKLPHGATIHEMDEEIDHGNIIAQRIVDLLCYDTSLTAYNRVVSTEISLFEENFDIILSGNYIAEKMITEGNYNSIQDFRKLCLLNLDAQGTLREHIDLLRSLSHGGYKNAFYLTEDKEKIFVNLSLKKND
ncbi:dTDP-4-amino-4,6-dideoxyglucose formyltransferase [Shewanella oncorhynchi]|uniref:dTDP-4-amino-4,6-dideoxyglucose formyltransferase n=1 Tax=Shewanella TaxID=22 RepID=UPI00217CE71A|nr:dTDP-4-amino-4,6-dideoxyglucose formyltransferase [Shewanella baltica]MCS6153482.1 dTDP-4-amino-4,6-dideoxyglucose formyltransferase [Shewanella baltica]